jgi:hypothetical protein
VDGGVSRALARLCGTFHNVAYYAPGVRDAFRDLGIRRYWHAYLAARSAPLGIVPADVVTATFYNFAPSFVAGAIPSVWAVTSPATAIAARDVAVEEALVTTLDPSWRDGVAAAAALVGDAMAGVDTGARPLFAAHVALAPASSPRLALWQACTLWREHRGDGHNIALAAAGVDGLESHVLLAGKGVVTADVIEQIRGWTAPEWAAATERLAGRGLLDPVDGTLTPAGRAFRDHIEDHTDELAAAPLARLGADADRLVGLLEPLVARLVAAGLVAPTWPPPALRPRP